MQDQEQAKDFPEALLSLALQSYAGRNYQAAYERLEWCKQELLETSAVTPVGSHPPPATVPAPAEPTASAAQAPGSPSTSAASGPAASDTHSHMPSPTTTTTTTAHTTTTANTGTASPSSSQPRQQRQQEAPQGPRTSVDSPPPPGDANAGSPGAALPPAGGSAPTAAAQGAAATAGGAPGGTGGVAALDPVLGARLGAVLGCQGDCCKVVGDVERAAALYAASIECLTDSWQRQQREGAAPVAHGVREVVHALCVSTGKLGDLHYQQGDLREALRCYQQALAVREGRPASTAPATVTATAGPSRHSGSAEPGGSGGGGSGGGGGGSKAADETDSVTMVLQALDMATSHVKVADVIKVLVSLEVILLWMKVTFFALAVDGVGTFIFVTIENCEVE
ncbi:MAG: hypothetical protein WDW38_009566 [Sanguina aurantia]